MIQERDSEVLGCLAFHQFECVNKHFKHAKQFLE